MKLILICLLIIFYLASPAQVTIQIPPPHSFGVVFNERGIPIATGFTLENAKYMVTCYHIYKSAKKLMYLPEEDAERKAVVCKKYKLVKFDKDFDFAILEFDHSLCDRPMRSETTTPRVGDTLAFFGFDTSIHDDMTARVSAQYGIVLWVNSRTSNGKIIRSVRIESPHGQPGFSGSPVVDRKNRIVGFIREGLRAHGKSYMNVYSIQPVIDAIDAEDMFNNK